MYSPHTGYNGSLGGFSPLYLGGGRRERWRYRRMEIIVVVVGMIYSTFEFAVAKGGAIRCHSNLETKQTFYFTSQYNINSIFSEDNIRCMFSSQSPLSVRGGHRKARAASRGRYFPPPVGGRSED